MTDTLEERAVWTTAYINNLADSCFLYVEAGGTKDGEGKTVPRTLRHFPYKDDQGKIDLPHLRNALARIPQSDLASTIKDDLTNKAKGILAKVEGGQQAGMPRDGLVRAVFPAELEVRASADGGATMVGHFAVFNDYTEINSAYEGNFLERIAPGAFDKTFSERTPKVLFNHGADPQIGDKVLGSVTSLRSDTTGAAYEVDLFDTAYNRDLVPGLKAGVYGASFRFKVMREDVVKDAKRSDYNPKGLPERTITEAQVMEFGPVTFPAYPTATAGIRSMTDRFREIRVDSEDLGTLACAISAVTEYIADQDEPDDQKNIPVAEGILKTLGDLVAVEVAEVEPPEPEDEDEMNAAAPDGEPRSSAPVMVPVSVSTAAPSHPDPPRRDTQPPTTSKTEDNVNSIEEMLERVDAITLEEQEIAAANRLQLFDAETQERWDALKTEKAQLKELVRVQRERDEYIRSQLERTDTPVESVDRGSYAGVGNNVGGRNRPPDNVFALEEYHGRASSQEGLMRLYSEGARRATDDMEFATPGTDQAKAKANLDMVIRKDNQYGEVAQYVLRHASPTYRSAFRKQLSGAYMNGEEQRVLGIASQGGQFPVPIQIDPTVVLVSNGYINPLREIARNVTMTGYEWRGVSTTGITAHYGAEGTVAADDSPTLLQPTIDAERAWTFVPYSFEAGQDWNGLEEELGVCIADAKDLLEATQFLTGAGHASSAPKGVLRSCSTVQGTALNTNAGTVFTVQHVYELETALPPRFRPNATWVFNKAVAQRIRQFDTGGGNALWQGYPNPLQGGMPDRLIGYPVRELTTMSTAIPTTSGSTWALFGDFSKFIIADRIGMSVSVIPQVFNGNTAGGVAYPTGQQGLYAFWRNSSDVMGSNAFRGGTQS